jgi:glycerol-3-phosphate acyltransferase PlsX
VTRQPDVTVDLFGIEDQIRPLLDVPDLPADRITIRPASQRIEMGESPVEALRRKPDTSIQRCAEALARREVDAIVSAGDTGGVVAASTLFCRRLRGVKRHGIAVALPTMTGRAVLCDVGANIHSKPIHLLQYAIMASCYAQKILGVENPRVGLLSIGEEEGKGNDLVKGSRGLFSRAGLNFVGNLEGQAIFHGLADIIVCDGFVGNVILKVAEGLSEALFHLILAKSGGAESAAENRGAMVGLKAVKDMLDYSSTGGAPLLGVEGSVTICHGRSNATAISNAIRVATDFTRSGVNDLIVEGVARVGMAARVAEFFHRDHA